MFPINTRYNVAYLPVPFLYAQDEILKVSGSLLDISSESNLLLFDRVISDKFPGPYGERFLPTRVFETVQDSGIIVVEGAPYIPYQDSQTEPYGQINLGDIGTFVVRGKLTH